jgi:hypothetical protein
LPRIPLVPLTDTVGSAASSASVAPHESDARDSRTFRPRRASLTSFALLGLAAAGVATWLHLRTAPADRSESPRPAAALATAAPATTPLASTTSDVSARISGDRAPRVPSLHPHVATARSAATAASAHADQQASARASSAPPRANSPALRPLDDVNPFANQ